MRLLSQPPERFQGEIALEQRDAEALRTTFNMQRLQEKIVSWLT